MALPRVSAIGFIDTLTVSAVGFVDGIYLPPSTTLLTGVNSTSSAGAPSGIGTIATLPSVNSTAALGLVEGQGGLILNGVNSTASAARIGAVTPMTNIKVGSTNLSALYVGSTQIFKAYAGPALVWYQTQGEPIGLSSSLLSISGQHNAWMQQSINIGAYAGQTIRFVVEYTSGSSYRGDFQIDDVTIDGTTYTFTSTASGWQTSIITSSNTTYTYSNVTWYSVSTGSSRGRWNRDSGGTPSGGTGLSVDHTHGTTSSHYLYTEVTQRFNGSFWLRSPEIVLSSNPGNLTFWEARYGSNMGSSNYYIDVIA